MFMMMQCIKRHVVVGGIFALMTFSILSEAPPKPQAAEGGGGLLPARVYTATWGWPDLPGPGFYYVNYTVVSKR